MPWVWIVKQPIKLGSIYSYPIFEICIRVYSTQHFSSDNIFKSNADGWMRSIVIISGLKDLWAVRFLWLQFETSKSSLGNTTRLKIVTLITVVLSRMGVGPRCWEKQGQWRGMQLKDLWLKTAAHDAAPWLHATWFINTRRKGSRSELLNCPCHLPKSTERLKITNKAIKIRGKWSSRFLFTNLIAHHSIHNLYINMEKHPQTPKDNTAKWQNVSRGVCGQSMGSSQY